MSSSKSIIFWFFSLRFGVTDVVFQKFHHRFKQVTDDFSVTVQLLSGEFHSITLKIHAYSVERIFHHNPHAYYKNQCKYTHPGF